MSAIGEGDFVTTTQVMLAQLLGIGALVVASACSDDSVQRQTLSRNIVVHEPSLRAVEDFDQYYARLPTFAKLTSKEASAAIAGEWGLISSPSATLNLQRRGNWIHTGDTGRKTPPIGIWRLVRSFDLPSKIRDRKPRRLLGHVLEVRSPAETFYFEVNLNDDRLSLNDLTGEILQLSLVYRRSS